VQPLPAHIVRFLTTIDMYPSACETSRSVSNIVGPVDTRPRQHTAEIPVKRQDGRSVRRMRQEPFSVLHDETRRLPETERLFRAGPVTDDQRQPCLTSPRLPFPIGTMNSRSPRSGRHQHVRALKPERPGDIRRIDVAADQNADSYSIALDRSGILARV